MPWGCYLPNLATFLFITIINIQASNFSLMPYLKGFETSQLEFESIKSY